MIKAEQVNPETFTDAQWQQYYALRELLYSRYDDLFVPVPLDAFKESNSASIQKNRLAIYIIYHNDKMIGYLRYYLQAQNNMVQAIILEEYFSGKLETCLANALLKCMENKFHYKCIWRGTQPETISLIRKISDLKSNSAAWFRLNPANVSDAELLEFANPEIIAKHNLRTEFHKYVPDNLIENVAEVANILINDMKREDIHLGFNFTAEQLRDDIALNKKTGNATYHLMLFDEENKIIGMSVVAISAKLPQLVNQRITGVLSHGRGKGLAKWLKCEMLRKIKNDFTDVNQIKTECFTANEPMINLNKSLGFELYRTDYDYYITPECLREFLGLR
jgi:RimJ/RimL family protein N-acetyltransferase